MGQPGIGEARAPEGKGQIGALRAPLDPQEYPAIPHHHRMAHAAREPSHRGKFESSQPWRLGVPASDITGVFNWHRGFSTSIARVKLWS